MSEQIRGVAELTPVKQALLEIRRLRTRLAEHRPFEPEPIAILGMAVRFPGGIDRLDQFWNILTTGESVITETPAERWHKDAFYDVDPDQAGKTYSCHGGFVSGIDGFDAEFFGITPREAESMDPQHRILLELTWEALEHAGIPPTKLKESPTGVFIGLSNSDYGRLLLQSRNEIDAYSSLGLAGSLAAGRISYFLDVKGPALVVDTACSSSLMAVHLASLSLAAGESSLAIVGASNLMLTPDVTISFSNARMLSRNGECKSFDAGADGYVRSEGCAVVILKRLRDARADGDRILAVIRGSAANHDGRSAGLTAPNGPAQTAVIRTALERAGMRPQDVDYVEAHGTGTPLGDPIELQALATAYGVERSVDRPLLIGSVKTNIGHLEAAAGLAGLAKVVLSLQNELLPLHRNFTAPSPHFAWDKLPISVLQTERTWPRTDRPRRAGLSSFGFSGTNVHLVLEEAPREADHTVTPPARECLFVISARSTEALREIAVRYVSWLDQCRTHLADICQMAAVGRAHHQHRLGFIARDRIELAGELRAWLSGGQSECLQLAVAGTSAPQIGIFCPPMSAADARANADFLSKTCPMFAAAAKDFAVAIELQSLDRQGVDLDAAYVVALQCALGRFWTLMGITPSAIFGGGIGRLAAPILAGLLTPREALARAQDYLARPQRDEDLGQSSEVDLLLVLGSDTHPLLTPRNRSMPVLGILPESAWLSMLEALKSLYLAGLDLNWDALYGSVGQEARKSRVELPTYAFQRQRFWRSNFPSQTSQKSALDWPKLVSILIAQSETGPLGWNPTSYLARWRRFDELTVGQAVNTLVALGEFAKSGARASADALVQRHRVLPLYRKLIGRWLSLLAREGVLREEEDVFVSPLPLTKRDLADLWRELTRMMVDEPDILTYVKRASGKLRELLTGQVSPLEVLFERGSLDRAEGIYGRKPVRPLHERYGGGRGALTLEDHRGRGPFRLVEVGAGTGGTTAGIAEFFPQDGEYWFTDLSDAFLARARRKFGKNSAFRFTKFNLDLPSPAELPVGRADVVLAANVVHATRDAGATLDRMRSLLKPGGLLILIESTTHHSHYDLTIAFVEGWSSFADEYRTDHPLLAADRWISLLKERGFVEAERFPKAGSDADGVGQHIVIGRNNLDPRPDTTVRSASLTLTEVGATPETLPAGHLPKFNGAITGSRREEVEDFVRVCAAHVMRLDPATRPGPRERFTELGMDSLMALQFQTLLADGFGLREQLPATIALHTGTVEALTDQILQVVAGASEEMESSARVIPRAPRLSVLTADDLDTISDDEVAALLAHRIPAIQDTTDR